MTPAGQLKRSSPFLRRKSGYGWSGFLGDCSGGLIAALIALPYGLALATSMGLPPVLGIVTSVVTAPITATLGRNPFLIGGTASATLPFLASAVQSQGIGGVAKVTIAASVIMMAFCVLRLGRHIAKVPNAVVSGFSCGIGAMMVISQLSIILGIDSPLTRGSGSAVSQLVATISRLADARIIPLVLAATVIVCAIAMGRWSTRLPAPLLGVGVAVLIARALGVHEKEVGEVAAAMPPFAGFSWTPQDVTELLPEAFALAFIASVNLLITSRIVEHFQGKHKRMRAADADTELGAYGIANIFCGMVGAPMSVGIPARSLAVVRCGGASRLANVLHAVILIALLATGASVIATIPIAALAGVSAWMGVSLLDWSAWRRLPLMSRVDAAAFCATALSVLLFNAVGAIAVGCSLYMLKSFYHRLVDTGPHIARVEG